MTDNILPLGQDIRGYETQLIDTRASSLNSTEDALEASGTFTGTYELTPYPDVMVSCFSDTSGTLYFDFSIDGTTAKTRTFPSQGFSVTANIHEFHVALKGYRYFRVRFVNDSDEQSTLQLKTFYGSFGPGNHPLNQTIGLDSDAIVTRPSNFQDEVRIGRRTGVAGWTKFGYRVGLTASAGEQTVWDGPGNFTPLKTANNFTIEYDSGQDGTDGNGAKTLYVQYVNQDGLPASNVHTLSNTGSDTTTFQGFGINRVSVSSSGSSNTNGALITFNNGAGTNVAHIPASGSVTQQCVYHIGANHDGVAKFLWWNIVKPSGGTGVVTIKGKVYNRNVDTFYEVFRTQVDTARELTGFIDEPIGFNLSPTDTLYFIADTDTNNANINMRFSLNEYERT